MKPRLLDVAERLGEEVKVIPIDIDKEKELAEHFHIQSVPTLIIFKKGKQLWRHSGIISTHALTLMLKNYK
jgi:thioredoxin 1